MKHTNRTISLNPHKVSQEHQAMLKELIYEQSRMDEDGIDTDDFEIDTLILSTDQDINSHGKIFYQREWGGDQ